MALAGTENRCTFAVDAVAPATTPLPEVSYKDAITARLSDTARPPLESWSQNTRSLVRVPEYEAGVHAFLRTVNLAYGDHRPLVLSPDMIWLLILQGLALHVSANGEKLRRHFVDHTRKLLLDVSRDEFVKGFPGNDWEGVFAEFSGKIRHYIGEETHGLIVQAFSTTGVVEKAAMEVALMEAMGSYFAYSVTTLCGIPAITLEGTPEDWERVREGAKRLTRFDLEWWTPHLAPLLEQFVQASRGNVDRRFWQEFYKLAHSSGGPYIRGHVVNLFPYLGRKRPGNDQLIADLQLYLRENPYRRYSEAEIEVRVAELREVLGPERGTDTLRRNPYMGVKNPGQFSGMTSACVSGALSRVPFLWNYYESMYPMEFVAGFVGVVQDAETMALRPEIGWAVLHGVS